MEKKKGTEIICLISPYKLLYTQVGSKHDSRIMYYYSYFSLFSMLDEFVPTLKIEGEVLHFDISYSIMKLKSMIICMFGAVVQGKDTRVVQKVNIQVEDCFWGWERIELTYVEKGVGFYENTLFPKIS